MNNFIFEDFFNSFNQGKIQQESIIIESDSRHTLWKVQTDKGLFTLKEFKRFATSC